MKQQKTYITTSLIILAVLLLRGDTNKSSVGSTDVKATPIKNHGINRG